MEVLPLSIGPILGATSGASARIWGRGQLEQTESGPRRCFGVARVRPKETSSYRQPIFFQMNPNFDMTGVTRFENLAPEEEYVYQVGCFFAELDLDAMPKDFDLDWSAVEPATFRSGADDSQRPRSFVFGSCRYLLRLFGGAWLDRRGDKTFRSILEQIDAGARTDLLLMVGDQIYADDLGIVAASSSVDHYYERYRMAFSQPYISALMRRVPTYMTLDDHEIENNWPADASERDWVTRFPAAIHAYLTYQSSHSPLLPMSAANQLVGTPHKLWYHFSDGCCDFFVTDTRTERYLSPYPIEQRIIGDEQMAALKSWLADGSGRVKFVATSVPFFPDMTRGDWQDKWSGFLDQRTEILDHIRENEIRRVVFLAGDLHQSMKSELVSPGAPDFRVLSLISSAFFWPYPYRPWRRFEKSGVLASSSDTVYEVVETGPVQNSDSFARVTADLESLNFSIYSRKGDLLYETTYAF